MAVKQYKWRTTFIYRNQFDPNYHLSYGVTPATYDTWQTADVGVAGGNSATYYYRDSNTMYSGGWYDNISSQVNFSITQTWTTSVDSRNNLTVSVSTMVNTVDRVDPRGGDSNTPGRVINVYKEQGGAAYISVTDLQVATAHNISGSVDLGTYTFTLAPGQNATRSTLYIHNQTVGSSSYDDIWAGVQFMNPLPADFRPGATLDTNTSVWKSHNRLNGACHVLPNTTGTNWHECRTIGEGDICGDAPSLYHDSKWYNQLLLGKE